MTSWWRHMTSCDVTVTSQQCDVTYYVIIKWTLHSFSPFICLENHVFWPGDLDLWPTTLSIELVRDIVQIHPSTNFRVRMSNGSAMRVLTDRRTDGQKDRRTDRTENITSTANAGGKNATWHWQWATCQSKNTKPICWHEFFQECSQEQAQPDEHIYGVIWLTIRPQNIFESVATYYFW